MTIAADGQPRGRPMAAKSAHRRRRSPRRYVVCFNPEQARRDAAARAAILDSLRMKLQQGDKGLVGNAGYRRFLVTPREGHFEIDADWIAKDIQLNGLYVLRTNGKMSTLSVALAYNKLWRVEAIFKTAKSIVETRPIYHKSDAAIAGHFVFVRSSPCSCARDSTSGWPLRHKCGVGDVVRDLDRVEQVTVEQGGKRFMLRPPQGCAGGIF